MAHQRPRHEHLSRRTALTGVAGVGIGLPLLAACSTDSATDSAGTGSSETPSSAGAAPDSGSSAPAGGSGGIAATSDIEVGGGEILADESLVITQPAAGEFKGFSSICTHQGCPVTSIKDGLINCTCHGSTFSIEDGSPQSGPASEPLEEIALTVSGDQISLA